MGNKMYALESRGSVSVRVNTDMVVLHDNRIVAISLYDAPALIDKITADLRANADTYLTLVERDGTKTTKKDLSAFSSKKKI